MSTARTIQRAASTYLVHFFGGGLQEEGRYVVERYETAASGEIRPLAADKESAGRRRRRATLSYRAVRRLRPVPNEIIVATSVSRDAGMQLFGAADAGIALRGTWQAGASPGAAPSRSIVSSIPSPMSVSQRQAGATGRSRYGRRLSLARRNACGYDGQAASHLAHILSGATEATGRAIQEDTGGLEFNRNTPCPIRQAA